MERKRSQDISVIMVILLRLLKLRSLKDLLKFLLKPHLLMNKISLKITNKEIGKQ
jgi:hypothetical protein